jgi:DNA-binding GntR family transcriptional regulator
MENTTSSTEVKPLAPNALRRDVVAHLLASIFQGALPAGTRLIIRKLAAQLGISATPIREALVELEAIGVVQFIHNRGAIVKPFGPQQLREVYHLRRILEAEAARCACGRIAPRDLVSLQNEMTQLSASGDQSPEWSQKVMATDRRLHELIAACCGDARLADEIGRYNTLMQSIREIVGNRRHAHQRALEEHMPIVEALLNIDAEKAAAATGLHVESTLKSVEAVMFQDGQRLR